MDTRRVGSHGEVVEVDESALLGEEVDPEEEEIYVGEEEVVDQQEGEEEYESGSRTSSSALTWISWFCSVPGHEYFCEVTEDFVEDDFNLTGLNALVPFYKEALEMILDVEPEEEALKIPDVSILEQSAELLYGLIHQRYIVTRAGLQNMLEKYQNGHFGVCPRVYCNGWRVLPCGRSDLPGVDTVKLYCANCVDTYTPPSSRFNSVDGAFFGTTFPHLFYQTYRDLAPSVVGGGPKSRERQTAAEREANTPSSASLATGGPDPSSPTASRPSTSPLVTTPLTSSSKIYIPKIYGFRVSERSRSGPRMQWMRMRPRDEDELDRVDVFGRWKEGWGWDDDEGEEDEGDLDDEEEEDDDLDGDPSGGRKVTERLGPSSSSPSKHRHDHAQAGTGQPKNKLPTKYGRPPPAKERTKPAASSSSKSGRRAAALPL